MLKNSTNPVANKLIFFLFPGVALLPFVEEKRLLGALSHVYPDLSELESKFDAVNNKSLVIYAHFALGLT